MVYSALSIGLLSSSLPAQQQTGRTYNPPVHIAPGQQKANFKYSGVAAPQQESGFSIVGSTPEPTRHSQANAAQRRQRNNRRGPQLQSRLANAFNGMGANNQRQTTPSNQTNRQTPSRTPTLAQQPTRVTQPRIALRQTAPIGTGVRPQALPPSAPNGVKRLVNAPRFQSGTSTLLEQPSTINQPTRSTNNQPSLAQTAPPRLDIGNSHRTERRQAPQSYPVQPIEAANLSYGQPIVATQPIAAENEYYDRADIRTTSAEQIQDDRFMEETAIRVAQAPERLAQMPDQPIRSTPVSILNKGSEGPEIVPEYFQESEFSPTPNSNVQDNDLRNQDYDAEDISADEDDGLLDDDDLERKSLDKSCDEIRNELLGSSIVDIALDISPLKSENPPEYGASYRTWTDQFGRTIASGTISSVQRGYVIIDNGGTLQKIPFGNLSDPDLEAVASFWQMPKECTVSQDMFAGRSWLPQTLTWKASNLCHKPLYFENVQLERYGHSHGPFSQPVHSTIHFFKSLALLPYNTGINPPNECRYALGYYRPGNCAPWLEDPFPISLAGARHQARAMVGGAFLIIP